VLTFPNNTIHNMTKKTGGKAPAPKAPVSNKAPTKQKGKPFQVGSPSPVKTPAYDLPKGIRPGKHGLSKKLNELVLGAKPPPRRIIRRGVAIVDSLGPEERKLLETGAAPALQILRKTGDATPLMDLYRASGITAVLKQVSDKGIPLVDVAAKNFSAGDAMSHDLPSLVASVAVPLGRQAVQGFIKEASLSALNALQTFGPDSDAFRVLKQQLGALPIAAATIFRKPVYQAINTGPAELPLKVLEAEEYEASEGIDEFFRGGYSLTLPSAGYSGHHLKVTEATDDEPIEHHYSEAVEDDSGFKVYGSTDPDELDRTKASVGLTDWEMKHQDWLKQEYKEQQGEAKAQPVALAQSSPIPSMGGLMPRASNYASRVRGHSANLIHDVETPFGPGVVLRARQPLVSIHGNQTATYPYRMAAVGTTNVITQGDADFFYVGPDAFGGRIAEFGRLFDRWVPHRTRFFYTPTIGTTETGGLAFGVAEDTSNPWLVSPTYASIMVLDNSIATPVYGPCEVKLGCSGMVEPSDWLFSSVGYTPSPTFDTLTAVDRQSNAGAFLMRGATDTPASQVNMGFGVVWCEVEWIFADPTASLNYTLSATVSRLVGRARCHELSRCIEQNPQAFFMFCKKVGLKSDLDCECPEVRLIDERIRETLGVAPKRPTMFDLYCRRNFKPKDTN